MQCTFQTHGIVTLANFITHLLNEGEVEVAAQIEPFTQSDWAEAAEVLQQYYDDDKLEMPFEAPQFNPLAAAWAIEYLYRAIQLAMLRELDEEQVHKNLINFPGSVNAEAIYTVDLAFRYLPGLLQLAAGLAPDDVLVIKLKEMAARWPFSSVGMKLSEFGDIRAVLKHQSLRTAYVDRVIAARDEKRVNSAHIIELVAEALGDHADTFWPEFEKMTNIE
jgi:hypothetical protein